MAQHRSAQRTMRLLLIAALAWAASAVTYDLQHLTQDNSQNVCGPVQDDEALFLFSVVRGMRMRRIVEIGGLNGYSARNFLAALAWDQNTTMYTIDISPVASQGPRHVVLTKDASLVDAADFNSEPLDMVFFDCHVFDAQMRMFSRLKLAEVLTHDTIIALHDTNVWPTPSANGCVSQLPSKTAGFIHQEVERKMVNEFVRSHGYSAFSLHPPLGRHDARLQFRHGVTLLQKFRPLI